MEIFFSRAFKGNIPIATDVDGLRQARNSDAAPALSAGFTVGKNHEPRAIRLHIELQHGIALTQPGDAPGGVASPVKRSHHSAFLPLTRKLAVPAKRRLEVLAMK